MMRRSWAFPCYFVALGCVLSTSRPSLAVDLDKETGLQFAPEDADFFASSLRLTEQWEQFRSSQLVQTISQVPYVQQAVAKATELWESRNGQVGQARQTLENPNVQSLLGLVQDMFSEEVFLLGDGKNSELLFELAAINEDLTDLLSSGSDPAVILDYALNMPKSDFDAIPIPTMMIGFKIKNQDRVLGKLDELEGVTRFGLGSVPVAQPFLKGLERVEDSRGTRLVWTVTSDMVPWDLIPTPPNNTELVERAIEKAQVALKGRSLTLTIGQLDEYLVLAISEGAEIITELGQESSLLDHKALEPVKKRADEKVVSIGYVSDVLAEANFNQQLNRFFSKRLIPYYRQAAASFGEIPEDFQSIPDDLHWIDEQIGEHVPDMKGTTSVAYMTPSGMETWIYSRTEDVLFDASQPLTVLNHVGGSPMVLLALRLQDRPEYFATSRRIVRKIKEYLDLAPHLDILSSHEQETWQRGLDEGWPVLVELADLWEEEFLPAMKDGQHAWVLQGGNLKSNQWNEALEPSQHPLPLPEVALITGLSDKTQMSDAMKELFAILDHVVELAREADPQKIPEGYTIPRPNKLDSRFGDHYSYNFPEHFSVPKEISPQALLSDKFMFWGYSDKQLESLARTKTLNVSGPLKASQACSSVAFVDAGKLVQFFAPWVDYAVETQFGGLNAVVVEEDESIPELKGKDVIDLWKALTSLGKISVVTTRGDGGGSVTHSVIEE